MENELQKNKILLVDDDSFLLDMYAGKFKSAGLSVQTAISGEEAIKKLEDPKNDINMIILDIVMPNFSGIETLEKIKKENLAPKAKIMMLTNQSDPKDIEKAKSLGIDGYITKAVMTPPEVVSEVFEILGLKKEN